HPLLAERDGKWNSDRIRREAVYEMYNFCYIRGLREVWGYMWASWYSPKMWAIWARSTSPYLTRLRTTMNVENFWRQLKHDHLHRVARPRLDCLVWILINKVTTAYVARAEILDDTYRLGRSKQLTTYQTYFKKSWMKLLDREISNKQYTTILGKHFTCTCGRQKYDAHLLCKHLVQLVGRPSGRFWSQVIRRRTLPFYRHPEIKAKDQGSSLDSDTLSDGGITDGDDHEWKGDSDVLMGGGGWKALQNRRDTGRTITSKGGLQKRSWERNNTEMDSESQSKRARTCDIIDLTNVSPSPEAEDPIDLTNLPPTPINPAAFEDSLHARSSSLFEYGSDDENQVSVQGFWEG
ncbi:hypothetical protein H0H92_011959, partial [Tricholoma furcatifolium]